MIQNQSAFLTLLRDKTKCQVHPTLSAVCHVLVMTSPTLPIAWESEDMALMAPMSCMMSSAAIVSPLPYRVCFCAVPRRHAVTVAEKNSGDGFTQGKKRIRERKHICLHKYLRNRTE